MSVWVVVSRFDLVGGADEGFWSIGGGSASGGDGDGVDGRADMGRPVANLPLGRRLKILEVPCVRQTTVWQADDQGRDARGSGPRWGDGQTPRLGGHERAAPLSTTMSIQILSPLTRPPP